MIFLKKSYDPPERDIGRAGRILTFGQFRFDLNERLLLCDGRSVPMSPKLLDTLELLIENAGHVVEKDEMIERLWPDTFVEEGSLSQNIFQLRKLLNEGSPGTNFIETIPKRGYRFSARVFSPLERPPDAARPGSNGAGLNGSHKRPSRAHSLAVLPFRPFGEAEHVNEYLGLGMTDAVIAKLCGLRQLSVMPTRTVSKYSDCEFDPVQIGLELGVDTVLDGTIQRIGEQIRLTVQMVAIGERETLWSETFTHRFSDVFDVQDSIAEQVANRLAERISSDERLRLGKRYTENSDAYQEYLMGLFLWSKRTENGLAKSIRYFRSAIEKDPEYARAYATLSDAYFLLAYKEFDPSERKLGFEKSRATALSALELDPYLAEAHAALGTIRIKYDRDPKGAEESFRRAIALNPSCAMAYSRYAWFLAAAGRLDESLANMRLSQKLDPLSPDMNACLANLLYFSRAYDEAIEYCRRALDLEPACPDALIWLGLSLQQKGHFEEAITEFMRAKQVSGENKEALELAAYVLAATGRFREAEEILSSFLEGNGLTGVRPHNVGLIFAALGREPEAREWLGKPYINWTERLRMLKFDPRMDTLKLEKRFEDVFNPTDLSVAASGGLTVSLTTGG
jgi:DNA-binding winged helix-turn-helix (wHTH) protein/tetratricopeptide (TPR) repeat protein